MTTPSEVAQATPRYGRLDYQALWAQFPPAPEYFDTVDILSRDELHALQQQRFLQQIARAWDVPFYQRHWGAGGLERGDVSSLDDLQKIPPFSIYDLREAVEHNPPWGDLIGIDPLKDDPTPLILQTSGGTTGMPRAMMYTPRDRETMNIITGRRMYMQGVRPFDLVQVALATGLQNAGFLLREALVGYTGAVPIITGTGAQTPTRRQIEILRAWNVHFFAAGGSYLHRVAAVARDEFGFDVRDLKLKGVMSWLGAEDRTLLKETWGAPVYDNYGTNEFGTICAECRFANGSHIFEDAFVTEIVDPETFVPRPFGERGTLVLTELFKYAAPMIRFNTNDVMAYIGGDCECGSTHRRLSQMFGRADNMIKFRGTSVFTEAVGVVASNEAQANGEYVCIIEPASEGGREELLIMVEARDGNVDRGQLSVLLGSRFKDSLGVTPTVQVVGAGELRTLTLVDTQTKPRRLIDKRPHD